MQSQYLELSRGDVQTYYIVTSTIKTIKVRFKFYKNTHLCKKRTESDLHLGEVNHPSLDCNQ